MFTEAPADISPGAHRPRLDAPLPSALLVPTGIDRNPEAQIAPASERSHRCVLWFFKEWVLCAQTHQLPAAKAKA